MLKFINNPATKKVFGIASAVLTGVVTVVGALADQKKEAEFAALKQAVAELQNQAKGS